MNQLLELARLADADRARRAADREHLRRLHETWRELRAIGHAVTDGVSTPATSGPAASGSIGSGRGKRPVTGSSRP